MFTVNGMAMFDHCLLFVLQFRQFIKDNISEKSRILTQAVEGVKTNINWMEQNYETIVDWLTHESRT